MTVYREKYIVLFAILLFLVGFIFIFVNPTKTVREGYSNLEGFINREGCPNVLIQKDGEYYLHNTRKASVPGVNPIRFEKLDEYTQFMKWLRSRGIRCPVLYLQQTYDTQGQRTYRMMNDPQTPNYGLPIQPIFNGDTRTQLTKLYDAGHNKGSMPGYDPMNQYIGLKTPLDEMEHQRNIDGLSDNPMDTNWGGVEYSRQQVASGKYDEDNVSIYVG